MSARKSKGEAPAAALPALDVQVLAGARAGTTVRFHEAPVTFGRDGTHPLQVDLPVVSRDHGFFDQRDGKWAVVNRSPNGLKLDRKTVRKRPAVLPDSGQIVIGDTAVLSFRLRDRSSAMSEGDTAPVGSPTAPGEAPYADGDPMHRPGKRMTRTRLLLGVVCFWVVLFGVLLALQSNEKSDTDATGRPSLPVTRLTDAQIEARVRAELPARPTNDVLVERWLSEADEYYALRDVRPYAAYRAMDAYRQAASYMPGNTLEDPLLQRRYLDLQEQLVDDVTRRYRDLMGKLDSRRYGAAATAIENLLDRFPDHERGDDSLHRHLRRLLDHARSRA